MGVDGEREWGMVRWEEVRQGQLRLVRADGHRVAGVDRRDGAVGEGARAYLSTRLRSIRESATLRLS